MIEPEDVVGAEWYRMTPEHRWAESQRLLRRYIELGGSLDPEPDPQSPFYDEEEWREWSDGGRHDLHITRRSIRDPDGHSSSD